MVWLMAVAALATLAIPLGLLYRPLGDYIAWVFTAPRHWRAERLVYRLIGVDPAREQTWSGYLRSVLGFSFVGFVLLYLLCRLQSWLPDSWGMVAMSPDLAFNTAASFVGNTNWQSYVPEQSVGFAVQTLG